ncbi:hypothetical protein C0Q70_09716 [Pomacea canaliculata]|uniref:Phosphatidylethanolamine-binding protein n=1 Tax=Pomacea canaliculata TaxID=400727 RepID=A0A2T7PAJ9_POMCA|nr:hypothetical protein C0Q70_09716 [Pomacea canaliculata]
MVKYPGGIDVTPGMVLTPTQVKDKPDVSFNADPDSYYTLIMHGTLSFGEIQHWLVVNIPGGDVTKGEEMTAYRGSGPSEGTGLHRYIFLVYRQSGKQEFDIPLIPFNRRQARRNHKVRTLVVRYGLQELVAGNFYQAEYDDYVPIARSTLVD